MKSGGIVTRRATAADLETVVRLRIALLREYADHPVYGRLREDAERRARPIFAAQLDADNEVIFLAEENREVIGLLRCIDTAASPLLVPERYCYVSSVYVKPERRRRGVLQLLLGRAREWCEVRGLTEMRLHNVPTSQSAAGAWEAAGFQVIEQVRLLRLGIPGDGARPAVASPATARPARAASAQSASAESASSR